MRLLAAMMVLLVGCDGGEACDFGWVDAAGELVICGPDLEYIDDDGVAWQVDEETAELGPLVSDDQTAAGEVFAELFAEANCQGQGYMLPSMPLYQAFAFDVSDESVPIETFAIVAAEADLVEVSVLSMLGVGDDGCRDMSNLVVDAVPLEALQEVTAPADPGWAGPLTYQALE